MLEIEAIRKLTFQGTVAPDGTLDWRLDGKLGATVVQSCVVTLAPVTTRIDRTVVRRFLADMPDLGAVNTDESPDEEIEIPEDETAEPLTATIDLARIMAEALALALPDYPRADGAEIENAVFAAPGTVPLEDKDLKPFAGLAALKARMDGGE